jgi:hypothetical protein
MAELRSQPVSLQPTQPAPSPEAQCWMVENRTALDAWDAWVEEHSLPIAELRPG